MSSSSSKILETEINVFKSNSQIMKNTKYFLLNSIEFSEKKTKLFRVSSLCNGVLTSLHEGSHETMLDEVPFKGVLYIFINLCVFTYWAE